MPCSTLKEAKTFCFLGKWCHEAGRAGTGRGMLRGCKVVAGGAGGSLLGWEPLLRPGKAKASHLHAFSTWSAALGGQASSAEVAGRPRCGRELPPPSHLRCLHPGTRTKAERVKSQLDALLLHSPCYATSTCIDLMMKKLSPLQETMNAFHCCILQKILPKECFVEINEWGNHASSRNCAKHCKKH